MFFEIQSFESMKNHSFVLANHYVSKGMQNNNITGWAWELSDCQTIINGNILNDNLPKKQLKDIHKDIQRGKIVAKYQRCLNKDGELFLHDVFDKVGRFKFSIYEEDSSPPDFTKKISIEDVRAGWVIDTAITFLVVDKIKK